MSNKDTNQFMESLMQRIKSGKLSDSEARKLTDEEKTEILKKGSNTDTAVLPAFYLKEKGLEPQPSLRKQCSDYIEEANEAGHAAAHVFQEFNESLPFKKHHFDLLHEYLDYCKSFDMNLDDINLDEFQANVAKHINSDYHNGQKGVNLPPELQAIKDKLVTQFDTFEFFYNKFEDIDKDTSVLKKYLISNLFGEDVFDTDTPQEMIKRAKNALNDAKLGSTDKSMSYFKINDVINHASKHLNQMVRLGFTNARSKGHILVKKEITLVLASLTLSSDIKDALGLEDTVLNPADFLIALEFCAQVYNKQENELEEMLQNLSQYTFLTQVFPNQNKLEYPANVAFVNYLVNRPEYSLDNIDWEQYGIDPDDLNDF